MQRIKSSNTVTSFPTKTDDGTAGYFTPGNTATGVKATYLSADWCNTIQEELVALATASGLDLSTSNNGQCAAAVAALISTAVAALKTTLEAAIALKAPIADPTLTGTPAAPTATSGTNTTQIATTAFVTAAVAALKAYFADGSYTMAQSGHVNFPSWLLDGFQIRWGRFTASANANTEVTFESAFSSACYAVVVNGGHASAQDYVGVLYSAGDVSASGFTVHSTLDQSVTVGYIAVGK